MTPEKDKLFLIDGHALMFRMYYAFIRRPMINSKGLDTSVLFGFMKYLLELIRKEHPTHLAIAFDPPCKTFRHQAFPEYKANRDATPEVVKNSLQPLIDMAKAMEIPVLMVPGFEADDVIGAMAQKCEKKGYRVYMVTPDKDFGQLVSDNIIQYKPGKAGGDDELFGPKEICDKFNITDPKQVIDILAIWGDTADNVPGVRGVGEVGAKKLVSKYGSVENILDHVDELPAKQAQSFRESAGQLGMSKFLVTIKTDIDLDITDEDLRVYFCDATKIREMLAQYECRSLLPLLPEGCGKPLEDMPAEDLPSASVVYEKGDLNALREEAFKNSAVGITIRTAPLTLFLASGQTVFSTTDLSVAAPILEDAAIEKRGYDLKLYIKILREHGIALKGRLSDIELMHYLINPEMAHKLEILSQSYLGIDLNIGSAAPADASAPEPDLFSAPAPEADTTAEDTERLFRDTAVLIPLCDAVRKDMESDSALAGLYDKMEMPLIRVLADMEHEGFRIDVKLLNEYGAELTAKLRVIEDKVREEAEEPTLNISSPIQLGAVLFDKLKLDPKAKKNARGNYTTDEETLIEIADRHPIINDILEFREVKKMISTYVEPLPSLISPKDGRIHTTFNQALTATGRLSSVKPNLQNIPVRSQMGREIRKAFIPSVPENFIVSADYSQIELRLMAAISGDPDMTDAFRHDKDVHTATAAKVFKVPESEVTKEQRSKAKTANFGIIYGISAFGLSQRLQIPRSEAKELITEYFVSYPGVHSYMEKVKEQAKEKGYVETLFHRKRYLPNIASKNQVVRSLAERNAINAPIQGTAADIIKLAMIHVYDRITAEGLRSRMILQVHDELVFDVPPEEVDILKKIVKEEMENVIDLGIPLTVECNEGKTWLEAH